MPWRHINRNTNSLAELVLRLEHAQYGEWTDEQRERLYKRLLSLEGLQGPEGNSTVINTTNINNYIRFSILLWHSGEFTNFEFTQTGFEEANSRAISGDSIWIPAGTIAGDQTFKAGVTYIGHGAATIFSGTTTIDDDANLCNLVLNNYLYVVQQGASTGADYLRYDNTGRIQMISNDDLIFEIYGAPGTALLFHIIEGEVGFYQSLALNMTHGTGSPVVSYGDIGYVVDTSGGNRTLTFGENDINQYQTIFVKNAGTNDLTVDYDSEESWVYTFDGASSLTLAPGEGRLLYCYAPGDEAEMITLLSHTDDRVDLPDEITATSEGVAASLGTICTEVTTNGDSDLDEVTLANGYSGQMKQIYCVVEGNAADTWKITPATMVGGTQITFAGAGEGCTLRYADNEGWVVVGNNGGTIS